MTDKDYENKKRECWEEFWDEISGNIDFAPGVDERMKEHIYDTFDRAYALGKEKETITQEVIESKAVGYAIEVNDGRLSTYPEAMRPQLYPEYDMDDLANAFEAGAQFALGKQEKDAEETVIQGWVARDANPHRLYVYSCKPLRLSDMWSVLGKSFAIQIDPTVFPDLTWESEPQECEILIKRKKKTIKM